MKQYIKLIGASLVLASAFQQVADAQTVNSAYFLEGAQFRHQLNPALQVQRNYISMPLLGNLSLGAHSSVGVSHFLYTTPNGGLTTFMNGRVDRGEFLGNLPDRTRMGFELDETILACGFQAWKGFNTFSLSLKSNTNISLPKEFFAFMKNPSDEYYKLENMGMSTTNYVEMAFGHSRKITDQLTVGAKAKILLGLARAEVKIDDMDVEMQQDAWRITPKKAYFKTAVGGMIVPTKGETGNYEDNDYVMGIDGNRTNELKPGTNELVSYDDIDFDSGQLGLAGWGMAFDLGATYRLNEDWMFSASLLDLGFISWKDGITGSMNNSFEFDGFKNVPVEDEESENSLDYQVDQLTDDLADLAKFRRDKQGAKIKTGLAATMNLAAQYTLPVYRKVNFGFLSSTRIYGEHSSTEARISANYAPCSFFEMSLNYALSSYGSAGGFFLNLCPKGLNLYCGVDMPLVKKEPSYFVPIKKFGLRVNLGLNITFGQLHKSSKLSADAI